MAAKLAILATPIARTVADMSFRSLSAHHSCVAFELLDRALYICLWNNQCQVTIVMIAATAVISKEFWSMVTKRARIDGTKLPYVDQGDGQPVVFVHGSISDCRIWDTHRPNIAQRYRVIALTQRLFGLSPWPDDGRNFSIQTHANDLAALVTALRLDPVPIVGRSYGGAVTLAMAAQHPKLVDACSCISPSLATFVADPAAAEDRLGSHECRQSCRPSSISITPLRLLMDGVNDRDGDFRNSGSGAGRHTGERPHPPAHVCRAASAAHHLRGSGAGWYSGQHRRRRKHPCVLPHYRRGHAPMHSWFCIDQGSQRAAPIAIQDPTAFSKLVLDFLDNG